MNSAASLGSLITGAAALQIFRDFEDFGIMVLQGVWNDQMHTANYRHTSEPKTRYGKSGSVGVPVETEQCVSLADENGVGDI